MLALLLKWIFAIALMPRCSNNLVNVNNRNDHLFDFSWDYAFLTNSVSLFRIIRIVSVLLFTDNREALSLFNPFSCNKARSLDYKESPSFMIISRVFVKWLKQYQSSRRQCIESQHYLKLKILSLWCEDTRIILATSIMEMTVFLTSHEVTLLLLVLSYCSV